MLSEAHEISNQSHTLLLQCRLNSKILQQQDKLTRNLTRNSVHSAAFVSFIKHDFGGGRGHMLSLSYMSSMCKHGTHGKRLLNVMTFKICLENAFSSVLSFSDISVI